MYPEVPNSETAYSRASNNPVTNLPHQYTTLTMPTPTVDSPDLEGLLALPWLLPAGTASATKLLPELELFLRDCALVRSTYVERVKLRQSLAS